MTRSEPSPFRTSGVGPALMLVSDFSRGCHRQSRYALKAQLDATARFDCSERPGKV
jgi:hypothetical protein